jgi:hypothetical protein
MECEGATATANSSVRQDPPADARIIPVSGDRQVVLQHRILTEPVVARVVDAAGAPLQGVEVTFAAAVGSGYVTGSVVTSGADGTASWQNYVHALDQRLLATANGIAPVEYAFDVTPSAHRFDGLYDCAWDDITIRTSSPVVIDPYFGDVSAQQSFSMETGALTLNHRLNRLQTFGFSGTISIDAQVRAVAIGTCNFTMLDEIPPNDGPTTRVDPYCHCSRR